MTEAQIQSAVIAHWKRFGRTGTLVAAIPNARAHGQAGLTKGLPDLIIMAPGLPVAFIELKTDSGRIRDEQIAFGESCKALGVQHAITRGRDEPIDLLERWGVVKLRAA